MTLLWGSVCLNFGMKLNHWTTWIKNVSVGSGYGPLFHTRVHWMKGRRNHRSFVKVHEALRHRIPLQQDSLSFRIASKDLVDLSTYSLIYCFMWCNVLISHVTEVAFRCPPQGRFLLMNTERICYFYKYPRGTLHSRNLITAGTIMMLPRWKSVTSGAAKNRACVVCL